MNRFHSLAVAAGLLAAGATSAGAQLSLGDAFRRADGAAFGNRIAAGDAAAQSARALAPLAGILPSLRFEAGYVRTTDPIGVFGSALRQRAVTPANFDPQRLNHPDALGNYQAGIVVEQPLFNADAWTGRRAALHAADATRAQQEWTRLSTRVDVVRAYYGAVLAAERAATLRDAARAAHAHLSQAEAMVRQGLATRSDALLAAVRAGEVDARLAEAEGAAATAQHQLAVLLGQHDAALPTGLVAPTRLPSSDRIRAVVAADTADAPQAPRADLRAAASARDAARKDAQRALSAYLPRLNSFARYDWNSASELYGGERNWTVGLMASWSPFAGASELSDIRTTLGRASSSRARADAAEAQARLELERTRTALTVALTRLAIAERGAEQGTEAHRIVGRKYAGGLATVVELLDAQSVETQAALALSEARWSTIVAAAERRLALGRDPATLQSLDDDPLAALESGARR